MITYTVESAYVVAMGEWPTGREAALAESIRKWEWIVKFLEEGHLTKEKFVIPVSDTNSCALCQVYLERDESCYGCPVFEKTGGRFCSRSPHAEYVSAAGHRDNDAALDAARQELAFLKNLQAPALPQEPGLYWARLKDSPTVSLIVEVRGTAPFFDTTIRHFPNGGILRYHIEALVFGPKIEVPTIE